MSLSFGLGWKPKGPVTLAGYDWLLFISSIMFHPNGMFASDPMTKMLSSKAVSHTNKKAAIQSLTSFIFFY
eukprot:10262756-Ditylum_brightwellii.AAC.1